MEDMVTAREDLQTDEELRSIVSQQARLTHQAEAFIEKVDWKEQLDSIRDMRVVKMPKII